MNEGLKDDFCAKLTVGRRCFRRILHQTLRIRSSLRNSAPNGTPYDTLQWRLRLNTVPFHVERHRLPVRLL